MKLIKNKELVNAKWLKVLTQSKFSNPFQTSEFYELYNSLDDYSADAFAVEDEGEYKSLVVVTVQKEKGLKGFFSVRGIVYGGPLLIKNENKVLEFLLKNINDYYKNKLIYLEIRNHYDYSAKSQIFKNFNWNYEERLNVQINLEDADLESVLSKMKTTRRRQIRQSWKEGAISREAKDEKEIASLYNILKDMYLERVKLPLPTYSFFLNLFRSEIGKVFVVLHDNKVIGGTFCIYSKNMTINTFYYTGLMGYHKKIYPAHIAIVGVIDFAIKNNLKMVDFMGAGKPGVEYGVRDYKLQFGGDLVEYGRFDIIFKPRLYKLGIFGLKILSKIK